MAIFIYFYFAHIIDILCLLYDKHTKLILLVDCGSDLHRDAN